jgi:hypothetical protein
MLMHVSFTASLLTLNPLNLAGHDLQVYSFALAGSVWIVVAAFQVSRRYREDLSAARARRAAGERHVALASHEASTRAAKRIPGARFVSLDSGGHLMLGQTKIIRDELAGFFAGKRDDGVDQPTKDAWMNVPASGAA